MKTTTTHTLDFLDSEDRSPLSAFYHDHSDIIEVCTSPIESIQIRVDLTLRQAKNLCVSLKRQIAEAQIAEFAKEDVK